MSSELKSILNFTTCLTSFGVKRKRFIMLMPDGLPDGEFELKYSFISLILSKFNMIVMCFNFENLSRIDQVVADVK